MGRRPTLVQCINLVYEGKLGTYKDAWDVWCNPMTRGCRCDKCFEALEEWFTNHKEGVQTTLDAQPLWEEVEQALRWNDLSTLAERLNVSVRQLQRLNTSKRVTASFADSVCQGLGTHPAIVYGSAW